MLRIMYLYLFQAQYDRYAVQVSEGTLLGKEMRTSTGYRYFSFSGIPYAEPPLGELRFAVRISNSPQFHWQMQIMYYLSVRPATLIFYFPF